MDTTLPRNIRRLVRTNTTYESAENYSHQCSTGNQVALWHEKVFQKPAG